MSSQVTPSARRPGGPDTAQRNYPVLLKRMKRLMEISQTLASTLDLNKLLHRIVEAGSELSGCEGASIMLVEAGSGELHFRAATHHEASGLDGVPVPLEGSIAGWVVNHSQPLLLTDA